jgi:hypothetical protein
MDEVLKTFRAFYFKEGEQTIKLYQILGKIQYHHPQELKLLLDSQGVCFLSTSIDEMGSNIILV